MTISIKKVCFFESQNLLQQSNVTYRYITRLHNISHHVSRIVYQYDKIIERI